MELTTNTALQFMKKCLQSPLEEGDYEKLVNVVSFLKTQSCLSDYAIYAILRSIIVADANISVIYKILTISTFNSRDYIDQVIAILTTYHSVLSSIAGGLELDPASLLKSWNEEVMSQVLVQCIPTLSSHLSSLFQERIVSNELNSDLDARFQQCSHFFPFSVLSRLLRESLIDCIQFPGSQVNQRIVETWIRSIFTEDVEILISEVDSIFREFQLHEFFNTLVTSIAHYPPLPTTVPSELMNPVSSSLLDTYSHQLKQEYLNNDVNTETILLFYLKSVQMLNSCQIHPTVITQCLQPIREELRKRDDTISCLFLVISRDMPELLVIPRNKNEDKEEMWGIQQIERENKKTEELDLMMECVRLYPDQFTFLKRVEEFFASQLLFHCEETEQTVVLEKLLLFLIKRLGRNQSSHLLVMLRDLRMSRQLNQSLHQQSSSTQFYSCTIISRSFWPEIEEGMISLQEPVLTAQKRVEKYYKKAFPRRSLQVIPNQGEVEIDVTVGNETRSIVCSIVQYQVLQEFCRNQSCGIDELCFDLLCPRALIQSAITFWMNQGAIICVSKSPLKYRRVRFFNEQGIVLDTQDENAMSVLERMRVYERFVTDILNTSALNRISSRCESIYP